MPVTVIASKDQFKSIVKSGKPVIVYFWATWCSVCLAMSPIYEKMAAPYPTVEFYKIDIDVLPEISEETGIRVTPTFLYFRNGKQQAEVAGANPAALQILVTEAAK